MQWLTDLLFAGMSLEEILREDSLFMMGAMILISVWAVGAVSAPVSKKF